MPLARPEPAQIIHTERIEKIVERIVERPGGQTEPLASVALPPIQQTQPKPIVIHVASPTQPLERKRDEPTRSSGNPDQKERTPDRRTDVQAPTPTPEAPAPSRQPAHVPEPPAVPIAPNKKSSPDRTETIPINSPDRIDSELFTPDKPAPQASGDEFKKVGKVVGRQRSYDDMGENDIEPVREVFLLRHLTGKHWPGLSKDMENYYEHYYFTKPRKGEKYYARHVKCWERRTKWIAAHTA